MRTILLFIFLGLSLAVKAIEPAPEADEARQLVKQFAGELKGRLVAGMKAGGPVNAIGVCNIEAPGIAAKLSSDSGWRVARTSLKLRNADNEPDAWEKKVLEQFEADHRAGKDPKTLEYSGTVSQNGKNSYRYMKAIPTGEVCIACHGSHLAEETRNKLSELYPDDMATGFSVGELRGAFSLEKDL